MIPLRFSTKSENCANVTMSGKTGPGAAACLEAREISATARSNLSSLEA